MSRGPLLALMLMLVARANQADEPRPQSPRVEPKAADGDAPLPEGFPDATKPGMVEVKTYPAYRSAVASVDKATMNSGGLLFFPLFNHIKKKDIAMTAPVISTFKTPSMVEAAGAKGEMTMEFLYRSTKQGEAGADGERIQVIDHPERKYLALGFQGEETDKVTREGIATLRKWLAEHKDEWAEDGPPRLLGYHGPMTPAARRLWEVQVPVKSLKEEEDKKQDEKPPAKK